ncbi:MAG: lysophospholipid acyltransferase family protein [Bauldia sp.]
MIFVRSLLFNIAFYIVSVVMNVGAAPYLLLFGSERANLAGVTLWSNIMLFLLRVICGTRVEMRGLENIPEGGAVLAAKHQSTFDTFVLFPSVADLTVVLKRELMRIPFYGWYAGRSGMIPVDRDKGPSALRDLAARVRSALAGGRRVLIYPEGTRRTPGAEPEYQSGVAHLYHALKVPVVPVATNSGLFWPRRKFLRYPGTIVLDFLPPLAAGQAPRAFLKELEASIEGASDRLLLEAWRAKHPPPFPASAAARVAQHS